MITNIKSTVSVTSTLKQLISFLKEHHLKYSFNKKQEIIDYIIRIKWSFDFPWNQDQLEIIKTFLNLHENEKKIMVTQGTFGSGKTTMILGMLNMGFWKKMFTMDEICFCAFNVCIKNEIKKKIKSWGCKDNVNVRTFDSLIYEFCRFYEYPHLKYPNYKGKRIFVYDKCRQKDLQPIYIQYHNIKYLFVDECQDLEKPAYDVFKTFFPNACIIFVGDIFQSIQKEPRESLLYYVSQIITDQVHYFYMKTTPRVPKDILIEIKKSLHKSYPEYKEQINEWKSSSPLKNTKIEWITFQTYGTLYEKMFEFIENHPQDKSMILTFSSCITVKGALGDLARVRRLLQQKGIKVNTNYKNMDSKCLFLSTANSSKGLERDNVFIMSTFPLEKAFVNFSNDLTTNLVTVAISRTKHKVFVCVPKDNLKFSVAFHGYNTCPQPKDVIENPTTMSLSEYISLEHNVTELLRQNILQYETRILFKSFIKKTIKSEIISDKTKIPSIPKSCLTSEEERSFVGVCIEVLITSVWTNKYPNVPTLSEIENNIYYSHCLSRIKQLRKLYILYKNKFASALSNSFNYYKTIFIYTELFISIQHKIFFFFSEKQKQDLFHYWTKFRHEIYKIHPPSSMKFKSQTNIKMPLLTGIADGVLHDQQKKIYEIKASVKSDWKEDAFIQAFCYAIMLGQTWFTIELINIFKNTRLQFVVYLNNVKKIRSQLLYDILIWNASSYLAKTLIYDGKNTINEAVASTSTIDNYLFLNYEWNIIENKLSEIVIIRMLSPTRFHIDFHTFDDLESFKTYIEKWNNDQFQMIYCSNFAYTEFVSNTKIQIQNICDIKQKWPNVNFNNVGISSLSNLGKVDEEVKNEGDDSITISNNIVLQTLMYVCHILC